MAIKALVNDTIAAQATPSGLSGIAVIRLAGSKSLAIIARLSKGLKLKARYAHHCTQKIGSNLGVNPGRPVKRSGRAFGSAEQSL